MCPGKGEVEGEVGGEVQDFQGARPAQKNIGRRNRE